jgi:ABC-2 type transport system ATP-binding protein
MWWLGSCSGPVDNEESRNEHVVEGTAQIPEESKAAAGSRHRDVAVTVHDLRKAYGALKAVDGVSLEISRGEVFALLGPNGAGKTTTVEILEGYRHRDEGQVTVLGFDPERQRAALKPHIGIVLQSTGVERFLTVAETLAMYADFYPHPRKPEEVIDLVGLAAKRDARVTTLSGGQQRRLDVGVALVGDPDLLFLDEPTTGFDPSARREAWHVVKSLAELGKTVLLTTHYMDEAQFLADRVAVISAGRIVAQGPPSSLAGRDQASARVNFRLAPGAILPSDLQGGPVSDGRIELVAENLTTTLHRLTSWAVERGIELEDLQVVRPTLEDIYLELTGVPPDRSPGGTTTEIPEPRPRRHGLRSRGRSRSEG